jgi:hypothetical protein
MVRVPLAGGHQRGGALNRNSRGLTANKRLGWNWVQTGWFRQILAMGGGLASSRQRSFMRLERPTWS